VSDETAWEHLRKYQTQCDPEGIVVRVSREALDETLDAIEAANTKITELEAVIETLHKETSDDWVQEHIQQHRRRSYE
jgi:chemotaxis regulatin CheY-phosphate phosphatase CheZ